jgi:cysteine-rich repeat protein
MKGELVMKLRLNILCLIGFGLVFFLGNGLAFAQTPDGETPSVETVCDTQVGAAFGLCNAYCEAMDCDYATPQASEKACTRVLDRFVQLTAAVPPCDAAAPFCGDGEVDAAEQCDDGNNTDWDGCSSTCQLEVPGV